MIFRPMESFSSSKVLHLLVAFDVPFSKIEEFRPSSRDGGNERVFCQKFHATEFDSRKKD